MTELELGDAGVFDLAPKEEFQPHEKPHPLAGQIILLRLMIEDKANGLVSNDEHQYKVQDWVDRVLGHSWKDEKANEVCIKYAMRVAMGNIPYTDRVLVIHAPSGEPHLIHVSEVGRTLT